MSFQDFTLISGNNSYGSGTQQFYFVAGILRNSGSGFQYINDSDHEPLNMDLVAGVQTTSTSVTVTFSQVATKICTFIIGPDETYAIQGISSGARINFDQAIISFGNSSGLVNPTTLTNPLGNFWFFGILRK
jgi:hypothetical protein